MRVVVCVILFASVQGSHNFLQAVVQRTTDKDSKNKEESSTNKKGLFPQFAFSPQPETHHDRRIQDARVATCDSAFMTCLGVEACTECFVELETKEIDWASVTKETPCDDVVKFIQSNRVCTYVSPGVAQDTFCATFNACVVWEEDEDQQGDDDDNSDKIDCSALKECNWPGFHPSFIGNGVCNDGLDGCYNTKVCGWDGGDCCQDTCKSNSSFVECGHDGFYCRNPSSKSCDPSLSQYCKRSSGNDDDNNVPVEIKCPDGTTLYRVVMYDSFGDGWDETRMTITQNSNPVWQGSLKTGSQGFNYTCLSTSSTCYHVELKGGIWGNEVSWEVRPKYEGAPAVAGGGAPTNCDFGVAGATNCGVSCDGKPNIDPANDPEYKQLKDLFQCIEEKCMVQVAACKKDSVCEKCYKEDPEDFCYGSDLFNALVDCSLCKCTADQYSSFCTTKVTPGTYIPPSKPSDSSLKDCTPTETIAGGNAVIAFGKCTAVDEVKMMVSDFDQNNFGDLDKFESCAHEFAGQDANHGGHTALGCLQILVNAKNGAGMDASDTSKPIEAIKALANSLYQDGEKFCDCAKSASDACPLCQSFVHFKTLLYESLDACQALDEIDCDAWNEFYRPCKSNVNSKFGTVDFSKKDQCDFVHDTCGGAGPFPSFRRLDCGAEIPAEAWDFYRSFASGCLGENMPPVPQPGPGPQPQPQPAPQPAPRPYTPTDNQGSKPTPKPYVPTDGGKPYTPTDDSSSSNSPANTKPNSGKKRSGWFWKFVLVLLVAGGGYYYYKRRADGFTFVRYRRMRNNFRDDADLYTGLSLESSTSFAPPSLPPTPASMGGDYYYS